MAMRTSTRVSLPPLQLPQPQQQQQQLPPSPTTLVPSQFDAPTANRTLPLPQPPLHRPAGSALDTTRLHAASPARPMPLPGATPTIPADKPSRALGGTVGLPSTILAPHASTLASAPASAARLPRALDLVALRRNPLFALEGQPSIPPPAPPSLPPEPQVANGAPARVPTPSPPPSSPPSLYPTATPTPQRPLPPTVAAAPTPPPPPTPAPSITPLQPPPLPRPPQLQQPPPIPQPPPRPQLPSHLLDEIDADTAELSSLFVNEAELAPAYRPPEDPNRGVPFSFADLYPDDAGSQGTRTTGTAGHAAVDATDEDASELPIPRPTPPTPSSEPSRAIVPSLPPVAFSAPSGRPAPSLVPEPAGGVADLSPPPASAASSAAVVQDKPPQASDTTTGTIGVAHPLEGSTSGETLPPWVAAFVTPLESSLGASCGAADTSGGSSGSGGGDVNSSCGVSPSAALARSRVELVARGSRWRRRLPGRRVGRRVFLIATSPTRRHIRTAGGGSPPAAASPEECVSEASGARSMQELAAAVAAAARPDCLAVPPAFWKLRRSEKARQHLVERAQAALAASGSPTCVGPDGAGDAGKPGDEMTADADEIPTLPPVPGGGRRSKIEEQLVIGGQIAAQPLPYEARLHSFPFPICAAPLAFRGLFGGKTSPGDHIKLSSALPSPSPFRSFSRPSALRRGVPASALLSASRAKLADLASGAAICLAQPTSHSAPAQGVSSHIPSAAEAQVLPPPRSQPPPIAASEGAAFVSSIPAVAASGTPLDPGYLLRPPSVPPPQLTLAQPPARDNPLALAPGAIGSVAAKPGEPTAIRGGNSVGSVGGGDGGRGGGAGDTTGVAAGDEPLDEDLLGADETATYLRTPDEAILFEEAQSCLALTPPARPPRRHPGRMPVKRSREAAGVSGDSTREARARIARGGARVPARIPAHPTTMAVGMAASPALWEETGGEDGEVGGDGAAADEAGDGWGGGGEDEWGDYDFGGGGDDD